MQISKLTNCNLYIAGTSYKGQLAEVTVPEVKHKAQEHKAGDMIGTRRISGPLEAMETTLKMDGFYSDIHALMSNPDTQHKIQIRCNLKTVSGTGVSDLPVSLELVGWCSNNKVGNLASQDYAKPEYKIEVSSFALRVNGKEIQMVDVDNAIHRVNDVDLLAAYRTNLGI